MKTYNVLYLRSNDLTLLPFWETTSVVVRLKHGLYQRDLKSTRCDKSLIFNYLLVSVATVSTTTKKKKAPILMRPRWVIITVIYKTISDIYPRSTIWEDQKDWSTVISVGTSFCQEKWSEKWSLSFEIFVCIHFLKFNQKVAQGIFALKITLRQSLVNRRQFLLLSFPKSKRLKGFFLFS